MGPDDDDDNDGEGSEEGTKKKKFKGPNMTRLLKSRMQKLISKQDDRQVFLLSSIETLLIICPLLSVVVPCLMFSWIYRREKSGQFITKRSNGLYVLKISLCVIQYFY